MSEALASAADVRFALDRMLSAETGAIIDRRRIIAAGHSYGANTALVSVGAAVMREGRRLEAKDRRFSAAIMISSPIFSGNQFEMTRWNTKWQRIMALLPDIAALQRPVAEDVRVDRGTTVGVRALR